MKKLPFITLIILIAVLAFATFWEKFHGTEAAHSLIYGSWWFVALWGAVVVSGFARIIKRKSYRNLPIFLLHISFAVILLGALLTRVSAVQGYLVLNQHYVVNAFQTDEGAIETLPFTVKLDTFYTVCYAGTDAPADYVSHIEIVDSETRINSRISMNNIAVHRGYRFYQSSYENAGRTSVLSVNRDVWGIPITYGGYALFALAGVLMLIRTRITRITRIFADKLKKSAAICAICILCVPLNMFAETVPTITETQAQQFGKLWIHYNGRITPLATFAQDFTQKLTGKPTFSYLNSEQVLMGFLFFPEQWQRVALFDVKHEKLRRELGLKPQEKAALTDFFDADNHFKLLPYQSISGKKSELQKEAEKLNEKVQLITMLHSGNLLQVYPLNSGGQVRWFSPTSALPHSLDSANADFVRFSLADYYKALHEQNESTASEILHSIDAFQRRQAQQILPTDSKRDEEIFYLKHNFTKPLFMASLTLGVLSLLACFVLKQKKRSIDNVFMAFLVLIFVAHTLFIGLRTYIAGRLPFTNGFETMTTIAWCAMLMALLFSRKIRIVVPFGFLVAGCSLLVAHISAMNPKITQLVPVLSSPLLTVHVSVIMVAYTLLAFVALNSLVALLQAAFAKREGIAETLEANRRNSLVCLYPAVLLLGVGIFVGAIWANVSWGRYWAWDPKETWALITFLVYGLIFHEREITFLKNPFWFHVFGLLAFATVLMTYFGVNYFLGGMHSYAG